VHLFLFLGQTGVQTPLEYCSSERTPNPSPEELVRLSDLGLDACLPEELNIINLEDHKEMASQTDIGASSSLKYDLNLTTEENEEMLKIKE